MDETVPTIIVGLSLGGYVAMAFAAEAPGIADVLVLAGSTVEPTGRRAHPFRALALAYDRTHHLVFDRLIAAFVRRRYPGGLGDLLVASGFAYRGGSEALRSLAGSPSCPASRRIRARWCWSTEGATWRCGPASDGSWPSPGVGGS